MRIVIECEEFVQRSADGNASAVLLDNFRVSLDSTDTFRRTANEALDLAVNHLKNWGRSK